MGIKLIKKNESYESDLEDIAQTSGEIDYGDAMALNRAAAGDGEIRKKVRDLIMDWRSAAEDGDEEEMTKAAKALKTLADSLPKHEARMHLGRCKNCGSGWTKTNYLDELEPDVRKYFKDKGYADNADICPKCVAAAKQYLTQGKDEGATYDEYVDAVAASLEDDFEYSPITALEFARDDFKDITKAFYSATKDPKEAAKEIDAKYMGGNEGRKKAEGHDGWEDWEEIEGLEESIDGIEKLAYELRHCIRGAYTRCKDWKSLALYIKGLASNLDDAAELMAYKRDDEGEDESKRNEDKRDLEAIRAKFCDNPDLAKIGRLAEPYEGDAVFGTQTWSDGVPVTKYWHRDNRSQWVSLKKGTRCIALLDQDGEEVEAVWIPYRNGWLRVDGSDIEVNFN